VFTTLQISLKTITTGKQIMWSHFHQRWTTTRAHVIAFLMDQPERRGSNSLLGGNSKQHALFGMSCNFDNLERSFAACPKCVRVATRYLDVGDFSIPMHLACRLCYGFSLDQLGKHGKYITVGNLPLPIATPGFSLLGKPGKLSFELLIDAWHFALRQFVHEAQWTKEEVKSYLALLCINKGTVDNFVLCCGNYLLAADMAAMPEEYDTEMTAFVKADKLEHPSLYLLPAPPSAWSIGTIDQRVETIMHLAMNTQKAVLKLVLHWASGSDNGSALRKRLLPLVTSVQALRLPYIPCRMFKNDKFGGFVAENYRAFTMLSPWLFRCLLADEFAPRVIVLPSLDKPRSKWTVKENTAWLRVRGIKVPTNTTAAERTAIVQSHHTDPAGPPPVLPVTTPTPTEIRQLLVLLFRVFATLFATDLKGSKAGNRFDALVVKFLDCLHRMGKACHPDKTQPIWQTKYGLLGLLRCRQHFIDYTYLHSLYEGGIEGEGMVKELRPLCPNAVRAGWPLNLVNAYNRQNILASVTSGFQSPDAVVSPTAGQHDANGKRYSSWSDVSYAIAQKRPLSIVVLGTAAAWQCHVLVRMFQVTYTKPIIISPVAPLIDEFGYVYHSIQLQDKECVHDNDTPVLSFAVMLPNHNDGGEVQFCVVDKDWRYIGTRGDWTYLN
jgi:hypothetical protein